MLAEYDEYEVSTPVCEGAGRRSRSATRASWAAERAEAGGGGARSSGLPGAGSM
ncbi:hypothetical protein ACFQ0O_19115 [Saccharopolyspora spinosporotrichia]